MSRPAITGGAPTNRAWTNSARPFAASCGGSAPDPAAGHGCEACEVFDTGMGAPRMLRTRFADENNRGLFPVAQLSRRWDARPAADGTVARAAPASLQDTGAGRLSAPARLLP